jgi:hypothetical protein
MAGLAVTVDAVRAVAVLVGILEMVALAVAALVMALPEVAAVAAVAGRPMVAAAFQIRAVAVAVVLAFLAKELTVLVALSDLAADRVGAVLAAPMDLQASKTPVAVFTVAAAVAVAGFFAAQLFSQMVATAHAALSASSGLAAHVAHHHSRQLMWGHKQWNTTSNSTSKSVTGSRMSIQSSRITSRWLSPMWTRPTCQTRLPSSFALRLLHPAPTRCTRA